MRLKKPDREKPVLVNLKVMKKDLRVIVSRAKKYAGGNLSLWLRHAGANYIPERKDLVP